MDSSALSARRSRPTTAPSSRGSMRSTSVSSAAIPKIPIGPRPGSCSSTSRSNSRYEIGQITPAAPSSSPSPFHASNPSSHPAAAKVTIPKLDVQRLSFERYALNVPPDSSLYQTSGNLPPNSIGASLQRALTLGRYDSQRSLAFTSRLDSNRMPSSSRMVESSLSSRVPAASLVNFQNSSHGLESRSVKSPTKPRIDSASSKSTFVNPSMAAAVAEALAHAQPKPPPASSSHGASSKVPKLKMTQNSLVDYLKSHPERIGPLSGRVEQRPLSARLGAPPPLGKTSTQPPVDLRVHRIRLDIGNEVPEDIFSFLGTGRVRIRNIIVVAAKNATKRSVALSLKPLRIENQSSGCQGYHMVMPRVYSGMWSLHSPLPILSQSQAFDARELNASLWIQGYDATGLAVKAGAWRKLPVADAGIDDGFVEMEIAYILPKYDDDEGIENLDF